MVKRFYIPVIETVLVSTSRWLSGSTIRADGYLLFQTKIPSVRREFLIGAKDEIRTRDPDLGKVVLYQLSYFRILVSVP